MKYLKPIIRLAVLLLLTVCAQTAKAQMYIMVHKNDGNVLKIAVSEVDSVTFREITGPEVTYDYVDMGLSVMWASCNIGATSPEQYGNYFAWGETIVKNEYTQANYKWYDATGAVLKYNIWKSLGSVDMKYRLDADDDVAHVLMGDGWHIPTLSEYEELLNNSRVTIVEMNGVKGLSLTSQINDNSIFIPLAGEYWKGDTLGAGVYSYYPTNTLVCYNEDNSSYIYSFSANTTDGRQAVGYSTYNRVGGLPVRPVYSPKTTFDDNVLSVSGVVLYKDSIILEVGESNWIDATVTNSSDIYLSPHFISSNDSVASVTADGKLIAVGPGECVITASWGDYSASCVVIVNKYIPVIEYVDLGLSVKWATCNVGASSPEKSGGNYAWGEIATKSEYVWTNYKHCAGTYNALIKYVWNPEHVADSLEIDNKLVLDPEDDAAIVLWGDDWRMPTNDQFKELMENCIWNWIDYDGYSGYRVTSNVPGYEKNSIFLPSNTEYGGVYYWTSDLSMKDDRYAMTFADGECDVPLPRQYGFNIRPVRPSDTYVAPSNDFALSADSLELFEGQTEYLTAKMNGKELDGYTLIWFSTDTSVVVVSANGELKAVGAGNAIITAILNPDETASCYITVNAREQFEEYVDLGLSVKWATCNLGASYPEQYGDYYAWGETEPYYYGSAKNPKWKEGKENGYAWPSNKYVVIDSLDNTYLTKYNSHSRIGLDGFVDYMTVLEYEDDAASVKLGGSWRIPTSQEFQELIDNCTWEVTEMCGITGYRVTSAVPGYEGKSIFMPFSGDYWNTDLEDYGGGYYWTSSLYSGTSMAAEFFSIEDLETSAYYRFVGGSIRPVLGATKEDIKGISISKSELPLALNATYEIVASFLDSVGKVISFNQGVDIVWTSDDSDVAIVEDGLIKAVGPGTCTIVASYGEYSAECYVTVEDPYDVEPESVDLGLSVRWATFNVGAFTPEMTGDFFAWGEVEPYYESGYAESVNPVWKDGKTTGYTWASYQWAEEVEPESGKYSITKYGNDGKTVLEADDDAAAHAWGGEWRMPDQIEFEELMAKCTWEFAVVDGVKGYKITSNVEGYTDNSIFLPITESRSGQMLNSDGEGYYWARNVDENDPSVAWYLYLDDEYQSVWKYLRYQGRTVRPVCPSETWQGITSVVFDSTAVDVALGYTSTLTYKILSGTEDYSFMGITSWTSSDESIVTVNDGILRGIKEGVATVTAYYGDLYAECQVSVKKLSEVNPEFLRQAYDDMYVKLGAPGAGGYYKPDDYGFIMIAFSGDIEGSDLFVPSSGYNWFATCGELSTRNGGYRNLVIRYNTSYNTIDAANRFIRSLDEESEDPEVQAMIGEAHALRAFAYLNLAPYFQVSYTSSEDAKNLPCVPLLTVDSDPYNNPRATLQEVYDQILSDLDTAIEKLDGWKRTDKSRIDQQVAYGLRARAYLNMGMWSDAAADAAIAIRGYQPASRTDVSTPFLYDISESNWIWGYDMNDSIASEFTYATASAWLRSFSGDGYSTALGVYSMINSDLYDMISPSDVRKGWWVNENLYSPLLDSLTWEDLSGQEIAFGAIDGVKEQYLPYTNVKFGMKYPGNYDNDEDWCWMRAEEMILVMIEGLAKSGQVDEARQMLTDFVTSYRDPEYDIDARGLSLEDEIWFQRRVELWGEGFSNNDLRRLNKPLVRFHDAKENNCPPAFRKNMSADNGWWLLRFPTSVLKDNTAIVDNTDGQMPEPGVSYGLLDGVTDYCANGGGYDEYYLSIYPRKLDLQIGDEYSLSYETNSDETVLWSSSDEDVATVDKYGLVAAIAEGYCTITATAGKLSAECGVVVMAEYNDTIPQGNEGEEEEEIEYIGDVQAYLPAAFADSNAVAAWYMNVTEGENSLKLESVFLFVDGTLVVTKSKFYTNKDGRQPEYGVNAYGTYELTDGDFNNGVASVVLSDGSKFEVEIEDGVMLAMGDYFSIQNNDDLPIPMGK